MYEPAKTATTLAKLGPNATSAIDLAFVAWSDRHYRGRALMRFTHPPGNERQSDAGNRRNRCGVNKRRRRT